MIRENRVLVTGATGFVGSNLVQELAKRECKIICLVHPLENIDLLEGIKCEIIFGNIDEKKMLAETIPDVEYIFHLAAMLSSHDPDTMFKTNFVGTKNLIEICLERKFPLKRFLFTSSIAAVGPSGKSELLAETAPCKPLTLYGKSKLCAENYLNSLNDSLPATIVRFPLVYGPRSQGGIYIIFKLLNKRIQIDLGYGETNVCFINDAVNGMIQAAESENTIGKTYFIGEKKIYSIPQIYKIVSNYIGKRPVKIKVPYFLSYSLAYLAEIHGKLKNTVPIFSRDELASYCRNPYWRFNTQKSEKDFGFQTRYHLEEGIRITADWYKKNGFL